MGAAKGNKNALGNEGGRPPIHTDVKEVDRLIEEYFKYIQGESKEEEKTFIDKEGNEQTAKRIVWIRNPEPPTVTGLTLHLKFAHKSSLYDYAEKLEFSDSIKRALTRIEQYHEIMASHGEKCTGNIFILKNFGWKDTASIDHTTKGEKIDYEGFRIQFLDMLKKNDSTK